MSNDYENTKRARLGEFDKIFWRGAVSEVAKKNREFEAKKLTATTKIPITPELLRAFGVSNVEELRARIEEDKQIDRHAILSRLKRRLWGK